MDETKVIEKRSAFINHNCYNIPVMLPEIQVDNCVMAINCVHKKIVSKGVISELRRICERILTAAAELDYCDDDIFAMHLAMEEAIVNAVEHGNAGDSGKKVTIEYDIRPEKAEISISDEGKGFCPEKLEDPRSGDNLYKTSGRGVLLIRSYMDTVRYEDNGRVVRMARNKHQDNTDTNCIKSF